MTIRIRLPFAAAIMIPLGILVLSACGGDSGNAALSNAELVKQGLTNTKSMKSYHMDMSATQGAQTLQISGDVDVGNSKYRLAGNVGSNNVAIVKIGSDVYVSTDGGATFVKGDPSQITGLESLFNTFKNAKPDGADQVKDKLKDGNPPTEKIDNVDTKHITANVQDLGPLGTGSGIAGSGTGTADLWISTDAKPLIRRFKLDSTSNGTPVKADITWTKIDEPVNITAPPIQ